MRPSVFLALTAAETTALADRAEQQGLVKPVPDTDFSLRGALKKAFDIIPEIWGAEAKLIEQIQQAQSSPTPSNAAAQILPANYGHIPVDYVVDTNPDSKILPLDPEYLAAAHSIGDP